jgi:type I restriction enzyme S subunit
LGALDDKILLLRETNSTLEAIAQALFKSWFVDFDPVRAKAEGREPEGVPPEIAELYPTEFEDSKLGEIPKGWEISHLGKVSTNIRAGVKPQNLNRDTPYIGLEHMPRQSISLDAWGHAEGLESGKFYFRTGQILFGKLRPYFHKVGIAPVDGVCSTDILVIEEKNVEWRAFCICHYSSDALIEHATMLSNGAKMPRSSWQDISGFKVVLPPLEIASAFNTILSPLLKRIVANVHHMSSLGKVRDELLAPLMSGKLEMSGAGA